MYRLGSSRSKKAQPLNKKNNSKTETVQQPVDPCQCGELCSALSRSHTSVLTLSYFSTEFLRRRGCEKKGRITHTFRKKERRLGAIIYKTSALCRVFK